MPEHDIVCYYQSEASILTVGALWLRLLFRVLQVELSALAAYFEQYCCVKV